ncbi:MAG: hypothetical protein [Chaetfec virus UA24_144]|nr:MAG: hypothetical protein [Chaetfec virus UA24_144]
MPEEEKKVIGYTNNWNVVVHYMEDPIAAAAFIDVYGEPEVKTTVWENLTYFEAREKVWGLMSDNPYILDVHVGVNSRVTASAIDEE